MINLMPGSIPCGPIPCEYGFSKEALNFGVSILAPVSSVPGSPTFFFLQPLLAGKVFASAGILITAQLLLFLADRIFGLESRPLQKCPPISPDQTVRMSLSDLQDFLASVSRDNVQPPTGTPTSPTDQTSGLIEETPESPLVFSLALWSDYTNNPYGPVVFFILPLFAFPGVRGALPLLILELLSTIFVRSVVPPQTTGSRPLTDPTLTMNKLPYLHFSPEDLLNLLNRFSKHFGT